MVPSLIVGEVGEEGDPANTTHAMATILVTAITAESSPNAKGNKQNDNINKNTTNTGISSSNSGRQSTSVFSILTKKRRVSNKKNSFPPVHQSSSRSPINKSIQKVVDAHSPKMSPKQMGSVIRSSVRSLISNKIIPGGKDDDDDSDSSGSLSGFSRGPDPIDRTDRTPKPPPVIYNRVLVGDHFHYIKAGDDTGADGGGE